MGQRKEKGYGFCEARMTAVLVLFLVLASCGSKKHYEDNRGYNAYAEQNQWMHSQPNDQNAWNPSEERIVVSRPVSHYKDESEVHYVGEYHLGYGTTSHVNSINQYTGNVMLGTVQGVRFLQYFQVGIGVDAQMLTHYYPNQSIRYGVLGYGDVRFLYPFTDDFSMTVGGSFGVNYSIEPESDNVPFYMEIGPGIIYKHLLFKLGLQKSGSGDGTNHFFVKVGLHF